MSTHVEPSRSDFSDTPTPEPMSLNYQRARTVAVWALWPIAVMTAIHKVWFAFNNHATDDFTTVWNAILRFRTGVPVYSEDYATVDPHYLYFPGGTLLLSPLSLMPSFSIGRAFYIGANAASTVLALGILSYLVAHAKNHRSPWRDAITGIVWPASIIVLFNTEAVRNTLLFSNINGVLLLLEVLFLWFLISRKGWAAGIALGLAITIKPQFLPLLFLPLVKRQWGALATGIGIPIVFNLAAWSLMTQPQDFFSKLLPYLDEVRDFANSSIIGLGTYFGVPEPVIWLWRIFAALLVLAGVFVLLKWRDSDNFMWASTTSSLLLLGVFLVSSLGQMYYSMLFAPLFFTVLLHRSVMHNPIAWLGAYFCLSIDIWMSDKWIWPGRIFEYTRGTIGWMLLLIAISITAVMWLVQSRRNIPSPAEVSQIEGEKTSASLAS